MNTSTNKKTRDSNIELLRIVCILMIIAHHFAIHPVWNFDTNSITANRVLIQALCIGGKLGVNCFLLISGYYLVGSKGRSIKSIARIWLQIFFYSVGITLLFVALGKTECSIKSLVSACLPITTVTWNYASAYFVLILFTPFLNVFLNSLPKQKYERMLLLMFFCWCIIPTITGKSFESNYLLWMAVLYAVGGYIRLYPNKYTENRKTAAWGVVISYALYLGSVIIMDLLGTKMGFFSDSAREIRFGQMQMLPCVAMAVSLFLLFKNTKIGSNRVVNTLATAVFGVYLIHEHSLVRAVLWTEIFKNTDHINSPMLVLYLIAAVLSIYVVSTIIELARSFLIERLYMMPISNFCDKLENIIKK